MIEKSDLRRVPVFADLPDDQLDWFLSQSQEQVFKPGETYIRAGDPAQTMFVIVEGEFLARGELNGETFAFPDTAGDVTGLLPFSRMKRAPLTGRAVTNSRLLRFPSTKFPELVQRMPELATRLVGLMSDRIRETTRVEQQRDRLAALGKLSAGLAHELNNPASAAKRAATQLRQVLKKIKDASHELGRRDLTPSQKSEIESLEASFLRADEAPPDALTASDIEEQIDSLLRSHGQNDLWQLSADLAQRGIKPAALESLFAALDPDTARAALIRLAASRDSNMNMERALSPLTVQYPATKPGARDTRGTSCSWSAWPAASGSVMVRLTTTACMGVLSGLVSDEGGTENALRWFTGPRSPPVAPSARP